MFKKKNVLFALLGIVIVMVLSACSSDSGQSSGFFTQYFVGAIYLAHRMDGSFI